MYFEEAEEIIVNFLRARVPEVSRNGLSDRTSTTSQNFSGDNSTVEFTITSYVDAIISVTVDGTQQIPYLHYNIDLTNRKIKFATAPASGTDNIVVSYKTGESWIYPDSPREDLTKNSFPRIGSWQITKTSDFEEVGSTTDTYDTITFQIDVVTYKDQICVVNSNQIAEVNTGKYIARQIENAFKDFLNTDLIYVISDFQIFNNSPQPYNVDYHTHTRIIEMRFEFRNLRRLTT